MRTLKELEDAIAAAEAIHETQRELLDIVRLAKAYVDEPCDSEQSAARAMRKYNELAAALKALFGPPPAPEISYQAPICPVCHDDHGDPCRDPYVGEGAYGALQSAQIDREEADTLNRRDERRGGLLDSAIRWEQQALRIKQDTQKEAGA